MCLERRKPQSCISTKVSPSILFDIAQSHIFLSPPIQAQVIFVGVLLSSSTAIGDEQFMILNTTQDTVASEWFLTTLQMEPSVLVGWCCSDGIKYYRSQKAACLVSCFALGVGVFELNKGKAQQSLYVCVYKNMESLNNSTLTTVEFSRETWPRVSDCVLKSCHDFYSKSKPRNLPPTSPLKPVIYHHFHPFPVWVLLQPALHWAAFSHRHCH